MPYKWGGLNKRADFFNSESTNSIFFSETIGLVIKLVAGFWVWRAIYMIEIKRNRNLKLETPANLDLKHK